MTNRKMTNQQLSMITFPLLDGQTIGSNGVSDSNIGEAIDYVKRTDPNCTSLRLYGANITDNGLKELKKLPGLTHLNLGKTRITDEGLKELQTLDSVVTR